MRLISLHVAQFWQTTMSSDPHSHDTGGEFHYFVSGSGTFRNGSREWRITPGDLFYSPPRMMHGHTSIGKKNGYAFCHVRFVHSTAERSLLRRVERRFRDGPVNIGTDRDRFFDELTRKHSSHAPLLMRSAEHMLTGFLFELAHGMTPAADVRLMRLDRIMRESIGKRITLGDLALWSGVTRPHLVRMFHKEFGVSPMAYLARLRIDAARQLLHNTNMSLREVAKHLHFYDEFHFSKAFRSAAGMSPAEYRKRSAFTV